MSFWFSRCPVAASSEPSSTSSLKTGVPWTRPPTVLFCLFHPVLCLHTTDCLVFCFFNKDCLYYSFCTWILYTPPDRIIRPIFMDPAKEELFRSAMEMQGVMLGRHEVELSAARHAAKSLTAQVTDLSSCLLMLYQEPSSDHRRHPPPEPRVNNPTVMPVSLQNAELF